MRTVGLEEEEGFAVSMTVVYLNMAAPHKSPGFSAHHKSPVFVTNEPVGWRIDSPVENPVSPGHERGVTAATGFGIYDFVNRNSRFDSR
jgi:hypothetical protein